MKPKLGGKNVPDETIHFDPGVELGRHINEQATLLKTSPGDAVRKLVMHAMGAKDTDRQKTGPKPKQARSRRPDARIHFRPSRAVGIELAKLADEWRVHRGEAAKRLVELAINGLDSDFHDAVRDLMTVKQDAKFEIACVVVRVEIEKETLSRQDTDKPVQFKSDRLEIARMMLSPLWRYRECLDEAEKRQTVKVYLTN